MILSKVYYKYSTDLTDTYTVASEGPTKDEDERRR